MNVVLVTAVGEAEGARAAAAALACAGADHDRPGLLIDLDGRAPRSALLATTSAQRLEERLLNHLPAARVAARGAVCHLTVAVDEPGFDAAAAAATVLRGGGAVVLHAPPGALQALLAHRVGAMATGVLLRADLAAERPLLALVVADLRGRGLQIKVLKRRLGWVAERRALFGALAPDAVGGVPRSAASLLLSHQCYSAGHDRGTDPTRAAKPERRDHAGAGSR